VIALTALAYASSRFEGGVSQSALETNAMVRAVVLFAALMVLGHYAWRAVSCTYPAERPVPWGFGDDADGTPMGRRVGTFLAAFVIAFAPLIVWISVRAPLGAPAWVGVLVVAALAAFGGAVFPLGLAGAVVQGNPLGAMPGTARRMWKADPHAARIAAGASLVFVGLLLASTWISDSIKPPADSQMAGEFPHSVKDPTGEGLRWAIFGLRAAGLYAALVSFRVAGLLVREAPGVREAVG